MTDIERKAKSYEEALEKAKKFKNNPFAGYDGTDLISALFPELKESEDENIDEKIRKALIKLVTNHASMDLFIEYDIHLDEALDWLEKQHKKDEEISVLKDQIESLHAAIKALKEVHKIELEKQSEQKYADDVEPIEWSGKINSRNVKGVLKEMLDKKLKSTDKIEAKFRVGDRIVDNCGNVWKIEGIINQFYILEGIDGGESRPTIEWVNKTFHLWTIQDAKDGDVLVSSYSQPFLFKEVVCDEFGKVCCAYGGIDGSIKFIANTHEKKFWTDSEEVEIATKEQRDALMKAMTDAGYTFDFEKKELKKIEQKSTDKVEPKFNIGDKIQYSKGCGTIMTIEKIENGEYIFANNLGHTTIEDGNKWYLVECNTTWSKEDEYYYGVIQYILNNECVGKTDKENAIKWFKSLKERALPQPKIEWSEEDEQYFNFLEKLLVILQAKSTENEIKKGTNSNSEYYYKVIQWFKSLKERALSQSQWKPSDEQLKALEHFVRSIEESGYASPYDNNTKLLNSLFFDLKKLSEE